MLLVLCRAAGNRYAIDSRQVSEVLPRAILHRETGAPSWLAGLMIHRGRALPVIDLAQAADGSPCPLRLSNRIVVLDADCRGDTRQIGLLAESVDLREVDSLQEETASAGMSWGRLLVDEQGVLALIEIPRLVSLERQAVLFPSVEAG